LSIGKAVATRLDVLVDVVIKHPYPAALRLLETMCNLWNFGVLSSSTEEEDARVAMPWKAFKRLFGRNPSRRAFPVPRQMTAFVSRLEVSGYRIVELKKHAQKTPQA
jgi:hypothetical protein